MNTIKSELAKERKATVAGLFYPAHPGALRKLINGYLGTDLPPANCSPEILIVPHAGYTYSGAVAGKAFSLLRGGVNKFTRVAVLGPPHRVYLNKIAIPSSRSFLTPLGRIRIDNESLCQLTSRMDSIITSDSAHQDEHCIEVQLPFLQMVCSGFSLLPFLVGDLRVSEVALLISALLEIEGTLIVISTDLSHYLSYTEANLRDAQTARQVEAFDYRSLDDHDVCGIWALRGALKFASENKMVIHRMALQNSGDTSGHRDQVVGYGAWMISSRE